MQGQDFRTHELIPSGPVAESESRVERTFSNFTGAKDRVQEQLGVDREGCAPRVRG